MGASFKLFGTGFAEQLISFTTNPFIGLFIGVLATAIVQSSSVTTAMIVGLTASGALTVGNAVPMIMGANIGTSVTNTIVSLSHITRKNEFKKAFEVATVHDFFNFIIIIILFPLELYFKILEKSAVFLTQFLLGSNMGIQFSSPLNYILKPVVSPILYIFNNNVILLISLSFILLFFSLKYFVKVMKPLAESEFKQVLQETIFKTPLRGFSFGLILTCVVQSSSVSSAIVVPLAGVGILTLEKLFPYILGANVGTTVTALLASLVIGSPLGVIVALEHVLFNTLGSIMIYPFRKIPIGLSRGLANLSLKSKIYPLTYIVSTFYILPSIVIFLVH